MSVLNQLFNRGLLGPKCKTCLTMSISRIKLLQNKRDVQLKLMRKEIAQFLQAGQEPIARIRVEHVIREQNMCAVYEILEMFCEFLLARVPILDSQRECPTDLQEAVASIIFAAPRCSDLPDLLHVRNLFGAKYGKEFISAASELRPDSKVNRTIVEKLSVSAPSVNIKLEVLKDITREYNVQWDSSKTEAELRKNPEDLLNGPKNIAAASMASSQLEAADSPHSEPSIMSRRDARGSQPRKSQIAAGNVPTSTINASKSLTKTNSMGSNVADVKDTRSQPSDVLERARAAIAAADRASSAARSAVELLNLGTG
ncbi:hypothetical protein LIER_16462 [Lithospermum erythrorhizon]|uniref:Regulator of Vps4 activity in the MVB pathway protein n=1 Tax=Lithospermum erythrorhizon TaxID=34254 RepID=A0AAV3Q9Y5_LITER